MKDHLFPGSLTAAFDIVDYARFGSALDLLMGCKTKAIAGVAVFLLLLSVTCISLMYCTDSMRFYISRHL